MERAKPNSCQRCRSEVQLGDRFCQECGLELAPAQASPRLARDTKREKKSAPPQESSPILDFAPPPRAADSAPPLRVEPVTRLNSPLLHAEIIDFSPSSFGNDKYSGLPKQGSSLIESNNGEAQLPPITPSRVNSLPTASISALTSRDTIAPTQESRSSVALLEPPPPPTRAYSPLLARHIPNAGPKSRQWLPGPLLDLLLSSLVLLSLTGIAICVSNEIARTNQRYQQIATRQAMKLLSKGDFKTATHRLAAIDAVYGTLTAEQMKLLSESLYQQGKLAFDTGAALEAKNLLNRVDASSARFAPARAMLVALSLPKVEAVTSPVKRKRSRPAPAAIPRELSQKPELSLPVLPEAASPPQNVETESAAADSSEADTTKFNNKPQAAPRCSEAEIAQYNRMLAGWFVTNRPKTPALKAPGDADASTETEPVDPPSFREWLLQSKPKF